MGFNGILWNFMEFYGALSDVSHDTNQYFVFQWLYIYIWKMTVEIVDLPIQNDDIPIYMEYIGTNMMGFNGI